MVSSKHPVRSFTAFLVTWSFVVLTITGLVLYVVPHGRVAYWTHWSMLGLTNDQWANVHMMFGGIFIIAGVLHLYFNWKPFKNYFLERMKDQVEVTREVYLSLLATLVIVTLSIFNLPPASWVFELNGTIKEAWVTSPELEPPFGHAEQVSLAGIAQRMDIDLKKAEAELKASGIKYDSIRDNLNKIAVMNNTTPMAVYGKIRQFEAKIDPANLKQMTVDEVDAQFAGKGLGRKTIGAVLKEIGVGAEDGQQRLKAKGVSTTLDESMRAAADRYHLNPLDLLKMLLVTDYRPAITN